MSKKKTSTKRLRLTRLQTRAVDRYAIEELCIPGVVLMENAGRNAADCIEKWLRNRLKRKSSSGRVAIICGSGNNGGDGFVVARHLCQRGYEVSVDLLADPHSLTGDAAINHAIAEKMDISIRLLKDVKKVPGAVQRWRRCDVIVDALLGTGFSRGQVRDPMAAVIRKVNALKGPMVVAIDVPSGMDCDTGLVSSEAIHADRTITFLTEKVGYAKKEAKPYVGKVTVVDIGAPLELILSRLT